RQASHTPRGGGTMRSSAKPPGMPSSIAKSWGPINTEAMPGTAAGAAAVGVGGGGFERGENWRGGAGAAATAPTPRCVLAGVGQASGDRAVAARPVTQGLRYMPRLLRCVDMRHDNPEPAAVEKARR